MPDKKLTDNEIVKALDKLYNTSITATATDFEVLDAKGLRRFGFFIKAVIDLINRLQEENEGLKSLNKNHKNMISMLNKPFNQIKSEAYKEFSERVKKLPYYPSYTNLHKAVDNLLKELEEK